MRASNGRSTQVTIDGGREQFALLYADDLAGRAGGSVASRLPTSRGRSARFVWYGNEEQLTLVVGEQERRHVDTALAIGLGEREDRLLRLVLPHGWHEPTLHRWPWLRDDLPLEVWSHRPGVAIQHHRPMRDETQDLVRCHEDPQLHLGDRTRWVEKLMRWAGGAARARCCPSARCSRLAVPRTAGAADPAHRIGPRCRRRH